MKKSKALGSSVVILLIAALIAVSFAGCFDSDETEIETTAAETTAETTEQTEAILPDSGFTINPESFLPAEKTSAKAQTEAVEETDDENAPADNVESNDYLSTLSANDIKMLNIFLSNFSEAYVENIDTSDMGEMIDFVMLNTKINYSNKITYDGIVINPENNNSHSGWVTEEYVAERVDRFFDVELENMSTDSTYYNNGKYYLFAADGETYAHFTKVTSATENADGTVTVKYDVYWYDVAYDVPPSYVYEGIGAENHDELCEYSYSGTAVVKPVQLGGDDYSNYKLVSLRKDG